MFQKLRRKIKRFFSFLFKPENREKGGIISTLTAIATVATIVVTVGKIGAAVYVIANIEDSALHIGAMIVNVIYWAGKVFLGIVADLYGGVLSSEFLHRALIKDPIVTDGWQIIRSFANMLIVLAFVVVGIATILRLREYEAQKLLAPLIIVAILINFSPLICGLIIDAANITMNFFLQPLGGSNAATLYYDALYNPENIGISSDKNAERELKRLWRAGNKMEHWQAWFIAIVQFAAYNWIAGTAFFMLALLLVIRQAALACLIMLSPLAFVSYAVPALREKIWGRWWQEFLSWTFTGVAALFFIYLGTRILIAGDRNALTASGTIGSLAYITPLVFIYIARKIIRSTSAMGASAVLGLAAGVGGFALGKVKSLGMKGLKMAGKGAVKGGLGSLKEGARGAGSLVNLATGGRTAGLGGRISSALGTTMERIGLRKTGATEQRRQARISEAQKGREDLRPETLARGAQDFRRSAAERAADLSLLAKQGRLDLIPEARREGYIRSATSHGVQLDKLAEGDYRAAGFDTGRVQEYQTRHGVTEDEARDAVIAEQLEANIPKMSRGQLRGVDPIHLTGDLISRVFTPDKIRAYRTASPAHIARIRARGLPQIASDILEADKRHDNGEVSRLRKLEDELNRLRTEAEDYVI